MLLLNRIIFFNALTGTAFYSDVLLGFLKIVNFHFIEANFRKIYLLHNAFKIIKIKHLTSIY